MKLKYITLAGAALLCGLMNDSAECMQTPEETSLGATRFRAATVIHTPSDIVKQFRDKVRRRILEDHAKTVVQGTTIQDPVSFGAISGERGNSLQTRESAGLNRRVCEKCIEKLSEWMEYIRRFDEIYLSNQEINDLYREVTTKLTTDKENSQARRDREVANGTIEDPTSLGTVFDEGQFVAAELEQLVSAKCKAILKECTTNISTHTTTGIGTMKDLIATAIAKLTTEKEGILAGDVPQTSGRTI